jgi:phage host-nuclease inhibitor protein Gam
MARVKTETFGTRGEFDQAVDQIARKEVERRRLEAQRDAQIQDVQERDNPAIDALKGEIDALATKAEAYAKENRAELLPVGRQSAETPLANFGFRWGNKTLVLLSNRWSWEGVVSSLRKAGLEGFIRVKEEVAKDAAKDELSEPVLAQHGMRIKQSETFWVEPKTDVIA